MPLEACDVFIRGQHLGFYQELEIRSSRRMPVVLGAFTSRFDNFFALDI